MTGASEEVIARLRGASGSLALTMPDLTAVADRDYASIVRVIAAPTGPLERARLAADLRLEAVAMAPARLNAVIEGSPEATAEVIRYLLCADAFTGQVLAASSLKRPAL